MGSCMGIHNTDYESASVSSSNNTRLTTGLPTIGVPYKNHRICSEIIRWRSDVPLTEGQLRSKRDEFWDTAPAFDGRKEIWDAIKAASTAYEALDFELAQAVLDGASITVTNGYLTECYDELGTQYKVPIYCLSYPINLVKEEYRSESPAEHSEPLNCGTKLYLKLRISVRLSDLKLQVYSKDTIGQCKKKLQVIEFIDTRYQRWFYSGKLLNDKIPIEDCNIPNGHVVQVIVNMDEYNQINKRKISVSS